MVQKMDFIFACRSRTLSVFELCRLLGISRQTGHEWRKRFVPHGGAASVSREPRDALLAHTQMSLGCSGTSHRRGGTSGSVVRCAGVAALSSLVPGETLADDRHSPRSPPGQATERFSLPAAAQALRCARNNSRHRARSAGSGASSESHPCPDGCGTRSAAACSGRRASATPSLPGNNSRAAMTRASP